MNFFSGREAIPVYRNIADEYTDAILAREESAGSAPLESSPVESVQDKEASTPIDTFTTGEAVPMEEEAPVAVTESFAAEDEAPAMRAAPVPESLDFADAPIPMAEAPMEEFSAAKSFSAPSAIRSKKAEGLFETDPVVQEQVYDLAAREGQQYLERNVLPQITPEPREEEPQSVVRSVYMESTRYFEEILSQGEYGLIPRLFDSSFILLFWARQGDRIVGCELDMERFKEGLASAIATPADRVRYLNILDSSGTPLLPFEEKSREEWRRPFVAKEISQWLPYWEAAILLRDPEEFQRELDSSRLLLTFMISALSVLLLTAMIFIYRLSSRQMHEVQQRVGFVTNVTHELKTPLTSIRLYSEMLSEGYGQDQEKVIKYSRYIASESQRLTRLIGHVLDFAKWDRGSAKLSREPLELKGLVRDICRDGREEYEQAGFTLTCPAGEDEYPIEGDREALVQVILNLLSNARKYSDERKEITLNLDRTDRDIRLSVSDRGIGISRKHRRRIFREFYRIDTSLTSRYKGTGLGLAIAAKIMKNHGGKLVCAPRDRSDYRQGSRFTMIFPLTVEKGGNR